jgi:hypothetical protein
VVIKHSKAAWLSGDHQTHPLHHQQEEFLTHVQQAASGHEKKLVVVLCDEQGAITQYKDKSQSARETEK